MKVLAIEPYYGGSHKAFLDGLQHNLPVDIYLLTQPARKWKWRMRLAAPYFADKIAAKQNSSDVDLLLCSSFVDVATLKSLLPYSLAQVPVYTYFHENQFAYPVQKEDERDFHFGLTNLTTALASDFVAFNTDYNLTTFLAGCNQILKICPDMTLGDIEETIMVKTSILHPGIDFGLIDAAECMPKNNIPVIVWNHRWEHDKNPEFFFETLFKLNEQNIQFKLIVAGQSFKKKPEIFNNALKSLQDKILHFGYIESKEEYARILKQGDIVVSTANHEFYGISVLEAIRAGCYPLLPNRLSYPELVPPEYLYEEKDLHSRLKMLLQNPPKPDNKRTKSLTDRFSWATLTQAYVDWFSSSLHA